jgi:hypothetical protein
MKLTPNLEKVAASSLKAGELSEQRALAGELSAQE